MNECKNHDEYTICEICEYFNLSKIYQYPCTGCLHNHLLECSFTKKEKEE